VPNAILPEGLLSPKRDLWFNAKSIVDSVPEPLLAAQVSLRRLNTDMPEQKLNLLQLSAGFVTQPGTRPSLMPHAALSALCRMPDHAESMSRSSIWRAV
jgi:hypothetical protein